MNNKILSACEGFYSVTKVKVDDTSRYVSDGMCLTYIVMVIGGSHDCLFFDE